MPLFYLLIESPGGFPRKVHYKDYTQTKIIQFF